MGATIKDVAQLTNLSLSTISKYINGGTVRAENGALIEEAIRKLGFQPNIYARNLRSTRTHTICCILDSLQSQFLANLLACLEKEAARQNYSLLYCCHNNNVESARSAVKFFVEKGIDGAIVEPIREPERYLGLLEENHIPYVAVDRRVPGRATDCVSVNGFWGGYEGCDYLLSQNHRSIAMITGRNSADVTSVRVAQERADGFFRAMSDHEISTKPALIQDGDFSFDSGYRCMTRLWQCDEKPTALFVSNYNMCLGAMAAIYNIGIRVPEELSVLAFDDFAFSMISRPHLTALEQPLDKIAAHAVGLLLRRIDGQTDGPPEIILERPTLHVRDSVRRL